MDSYLDEKIKLLGKTLFEDVDSNKAREVLDLVEKACNSRQYDELGNLMDLMSNRELNFTKNISNEQLHQAIDIVDDMYKHGIAINYTSRTKSTVEKNKTLDEKMNELAEILFDNNISNEILEFLKGVKTIIEDNNIYSLSFIKEQLKKRELTLFENIEMEKIDNAINYIDKTFKEYAAKNIIIPTTSEELIPISKSEEIVLANDMLEIEKVEKLIAELEKKGLSKEEIDKNIKDKALISEKSDALQKLANNSYNGIKDYEWDYRLNQEAIEELYADGFVPGTLEYENALRLSYGIMGEIIPRKGIKTSDYNWDPRLNQEAIDDLFAEGLVPQTPEYENALMTNYNISPIEQQLRELENKSQGLGHLLEPSLKLKQLIEIRDAYYQIQNDLVSEMKEQDLEERNIDEIIINKINEHIKNEIIQKWNNPDKMRTELKDSIKEKLLTKENTLNTEPKKQDIMWKKALAGSAGFATGIGISIAVANAPVLGTALTIYAGTRMAYNAAKIGCKIVTKINKGNEPVVIQKIRDKIPDKVKKIAKVIFEKPKNQYAKWFVNGASIGYLVGNIFDIGDKIAGLKNTPQTEELPTSTPTDPVTFTPVANPTSSIDFNPGDTYDLSSISQGYIASGSNNPLNLITKAGEDAVFDKSILVNGEKWLHFKQSNGLGYAWFKASDVEKALEVAETAGKAIGRS